MAKRGKKETTVETSNLPVPVRVGMVPLEEQDREIKVLEGEVVDSAGDALVAGRPWEAWPEMEKATLPVNALTVKPSERNERWLDLVVPGYDPLPLTRPIMGRLGWLGQFPEDFVLKLPPAIAADVVNARLKEAKGRPVNVVKEGDEWVALSPETRSLLPAKELAGLIYDSLQKTYGGAPDLEPEVPAEPYYQGGVMTMRFLTPVRETVRRDMEIAKRMNLHHRPKDDVLRMGLHVRQSYGDPLQIALFVSRVLCVNGIISDCEEFLWTSNNSRSLDGQRAWVVERIEKLAPTFQLMLTGAERMANTLLPDAPVPDQMKEWARRNGIQDRYVPFARAAWEEQVREEGADRTEWGMANAFTRAFRDLREDTRLGGGVRIEMMERVGAALRDDEIVTARLRRRDALRVRAEIVEAA